MANLEGLSMEELLVLAGSSFVEEPRSERLQVHASADDVAREIARRVTKKTLEERKLLDQPELVARWVALRYARDDQEVLGALYLDVRSRLIEDREVFRGTVGKCSVDVRPILRGAIECGASTIVLFHTHPSGDPSPSAQDILFTEKLHAATRTLSLVLADHVICGSADRFTSLHRTGALK